MVTLAATSLGALLAGFLLLDVFRTVFHPQGHGGPFHKALNRTLWWLARGLGRLCPPATKDRLLAVVGPLNAVLGVAAWGCWLIVSFAIVYWPRQDDFAAATESASPWVDSLYYSGYVVSTLGLGDLVPVGPVLRLLTVVEAMSGFALFAVATTYLLAIYKVVALEQTLALELSMVLGEGRRRLTESWDGGLSPEFSAWCLATVRSLLEVTHAHGQYPVLHYFRPTDSRLALVVQLPEVLRFLRGVSGNPPMQQLLLRAVRYHLHSLDQGCLPSPPLGLEATGAPDEEVSEVLGRLLEYLGYSDLGGPDVE